MWAQLGLLQLDKTKASIVLNPSSLAIWSVWYCNYSLVCCYAASDKFLFLKPCLTNQANTSLNYTQASKESKTPAETWNVTHIQHGLAGCQLTCERSPPEDEENTCRQRARESNPWWKASDSLNYARGKPEDHQSHILPRGLSTTGITTQLQSFSVDPRSFPPFCYRINSICQRRLWFVMQQLHKSLFMQSFQPK